MKEQQMASFEDILNTPAASIKSPEPLPVGSYICIVDGPGEFVQLGVNQTHALKLNLKPLQPQQDVDQEQLIESLDGQTLADKRIPVTFFITDESKHRVRNWCRDALGIEEGTKSLKEMISEIPGRQVVASVGHRAAKDGQAVYMEVKGWARV